MKKITKKKTVKKVSKKATKKVAKKAVKKASKKVAKKKKATKKTKKVVKSKSEQRRLAVQKPSEATVVANEVPAYTKDGHQIGEDLSSLDQPSL